MARKFFSSLVWHQTSDVIVRDSVVLDASSMPGYQVFLEIDPMDDASSGSKYTARRVVRQK